MSTPTPRKGALYVEEIASLRDELAQEAGLDSLSALLNTASYITHHISYIHLWFDTDMRLLTLSVEMSYTISVLSLCIFYGVTVRTAITISPRYSKFPLLPSHSS